MELGSGQAWASPALRELLGIGADEPADLAGALRRGVHPDDRPRLDAALAAAETQPDAVAFGVRALRPDGSVRHLHLTWRVERDAATGATRMHGTAQDVTAVVTGAFAVGDRARQLRGVIDAVPHQVTVKDAEGRILVANAAYAEAYGRTPSEVEGRLQADLHPRPEELDRLSGHDREAIASGRARHAEESFRDPSGAEHVLDTVRIPYREDGRSLVLGIAVDVTARVRAEQERARLALALDQAAEGIALLDPRGTIVYANRALARMLETPLEELVGGPFAALSTGSRDDEALLREIARTVFAGRVWAGRYESAWTDGSRHVRDASITPVRDAAGRPAGVVGVIRDVTREVELEEGLHQAHKLEALGRLAGGVAHDFNNVLTVITSCAEELDQALPPGSSEREAAREIARAAARSAEMIGQLLAFSRRQPLRPEPLDLNAVVSGLASMLERLLPSQVELETRLDPEAGWVQADRGQLERALVNLVLNARDAMPEGGRLRIETSAGHGEDADRVRLSVRDTGVGMDRETLARVFEPFFTTKAPGRGSGLGLPAVHGFAQQSGGSVAVESEPGKGTAMQVLLPTTEARSASRAEPPAPAASNAGARVLVAEDEDAIRALVARTLRRAGYRVLEAGDGREALATLQAEGPVDLVLADLRMPAMGGAELREKLRAAEPAPVVLLMSGFPGAEAVADGPAVLAKPFRPSALLRAVRSALAARPGSERAPGADPTGAGQVAS